MKHRMMRRILCAAVCLLVFLQCGLLAMAQDTFLYPSILNYSSSIAYTDAQCGAAFRYLSAVMDPVYVPRVYDLIYRAQYRLSLYGGSNWPYWNTGDAVTQIDDAVLGRQYIYPAKGCNAYARYAAVYTRGTQGTLVRASSYFGRSEPFLPTADQIHTFIRAYADVGERILTGYFNATARELRPHSLFFLAQDPQEDGFYFLCQDGDGNGQTMRYITYAYLAELLRYHTQYGYALAIADTNGGRKTPEEPIWGSVESVSPGNLEFSAQKQNKIALSGYAIHRASGSLRVQLLCDGKVIASGTKTARSDLTKWYPGCTTIGFSVSADLSALTTGRHELSLCVSDANHEIVLWRAQATADNLVHTAELPAEQTVRLTADAPSLQLTGWAYERTGVPLSFSFSVDGDTARPLTAQPRPEVAQTHSDCAFTDVGYDLLLDFPTTQAHNYRIDLYASVNGAQILLRSITAYVPAAPSGSVYPVDVQLHTTPEPTLPFGGTLDKQAVSLLVTYSDGTSSVVTEGFTCTDVRTDVPGKQTVYVQYDTFTCSFEVRVLPQIPPESVHLQAPQQLLQRGKTMRVDTTIDPTQANGYHMQWTTSDSSVATVDETGTVTGLRYGRCTITAQLLDPDGETLCADSVQVRVCSPLRIFLRQILDRIRSVFGVHIYY